MTSRQPETTPPGIPPGSGRAPAGRGPGEQVAGGQSPGGQVAGEQVAGSGPGRASGPWPLVVPLALLIVLGIAGLHGSVVQPRWNGPWHRDGVAIGIALEVVLGVLLVVTLRRRSANIRGQGVNAVAAKLHAVLIFVLSAGMIAVAVAVIAGLHLHLFTEAPGKPPGPVHLSTRRPSQPRAQHPFIVLHVSTLDLLYALLILALLAAVWLSVWWSRRFRLRGVAGRDGLIAEDSEDLRQAVESGRSALRTLDDARAAIIACYVAMENRLAELGAARAVADTPDELLARATQGGIVRGTAAARLTVLFYEARFSSHPLDRGQRDAAEQALDELAAALKRSEPAGAQPHGAGA